MYIEYSRAHLVTTTSHKLWAQLTSKKWFSTLRTCDAIGSSACNCWWVTRRDFWVNALPQTGQTNFKPKCIRWCLVRSNFLVNDFSQTSQPKDFTPECIFWWSAKYLFVTNDFSQLGQLNTFSLEWVFWCSNKLYLSENDFLHSEQVNSFILECVRSCLVKSDFFVNDFSQSEQLNDLALEFGDLALLGLVLIKFTSQSSGWSLGFDEASCSSVLSLAELLFGSGHENSFWSTCK